MTVQLHNRQYAHILGNADKLRHLGKLCDTVIVVDGQAFQAHSLVLACASRKLEQQLVNAEEGLRRYSTIDNISPHTFQQILDYAYRETLEVCTKDLQDLLKAAELLEMHQLEEQCLAQLKMLTITHRVPDTPGAAGVPGGALASEATPSTAPPEEHSDIEVVEAPPCPSSHGEKPRPDDTSQGAVPPRVSVIASTTTSQPTPSPSRSSKHGWNTVTSRGMAHTSGDFLAIRSLQSARPLLAYSLPFSTPMCSLYPPPALSQVHDSIMGYAGLFHPFHHSLLPAAQKLAATVKQDPLGKKGSFDTALIGNVPEEEERKLQGSADRIFRCVHCHKEFLDNRRLQRHPIIPSVPTEPLFCPYCGKSQGVRRGPLPQHARRWGHICPVCSRSFASNTALRRHQRLHTGEMTLGCEYCDRCFRDESSLRSHRRIHSGEKPYQCQRCLKRFSLKHQLDTHYRVHTGEKPFECRLCGQRSRDYSAMIKHLRTHGGAAPYQCTICLEYCNSLAAMQKHLKTHPVQDFPSDWNINNTYLYTSHS